MNCPVCTSLTLSRTDLDENLPAYSCSGCGGAWLSSREYWRWLDSHGPALPETPPQLTAITAADSPKVKICPECRRLMLRYNVGHGTGIALDQCPACNGIWCDRGEWDLLKSRNLHDEVHLVFTAPWQTAVRKEESRARLDAIYRQRFGSDYDELIRIRGWVYNHPERDHIIAFLTDPEPYRA